LGTRDAGVPAPWLSRARLRLGEAARRARALSLPDTFQKMSACDVIVCCSDSDRTDRLDGLAYARMADGLIEELERRGAVVQSLALPYAKLAGAATWAQAHSANRLFFFRSVMDRLRRLMCGRSRLEAKAEDFYTRLLMKTGAASLVGIGLPVAAVRAARVANIRSVEILHGYGYSAVPWGWDSEASQGLPDIVLVFDAVSAATFRQLEDSGVSVLTIDNYWYRKFLDPHEVLRLPLAWRDTSWLPPRRKIVLVSLSWGYDGDHGGYTFFAGILKNGLFPDELVDVIRQAGDAYHWVFRLHPVQLTGSRFGHYKNLLDQLCREYGNCEWEMGSHAALPALLSRCDAHVSMVSMTAYDAAFLGIRSLMLCPTLKVGGPYELMFRDLEAQGFLNRGDFDVQKILAWLQSTTKMPRARPVRADTGMAELCALLRGSDVVRSRLQDGALV
jgi:hypothetical protein